MTRRVPIAPQLRGRVPTRVLPALARRGFTVHRVGRAVYVHGEGLHVIGGAWDGPPPAWAGRLGCVSEGYLRRLERLERLHHARWMLRSAAGRFLARLPWWRVPGVPAYRHEPRRPSLFELTWGRP